MPACKDAKDLENIEVNGISLNKLMLCLSNIKKKMKNIFAVVNFSLILACLWAPNITDYEEKKAQRCLVIVLTKQASLLVRPCTQTIFLPGSSVEKKKTVKRLSKSNVNCQKTATFVWKCRSLQFFLPIYCQYKIEIAVINTTSLKQKHFRLFKTIYEHIFFDQQ